MTTIIIIVVVALVFFVTVCVATFMVWKREAEIRTDSIRAIESNLERLGDRLAAESQPEEREPWQDTLPEEPADPVWQEPAVSEHEPLKRMRRTRSRDPFGWVRDGGTPEVPQQAENSQQTGQHEMQPQRMPDVQEEIVLPDEALFRNDAALQDDVPLQPEASLQNDVSLLSGEPLQSEVTVQSEVPLQYDEPAVSCEPEFAEAPVIDEADMPQTEAYEEETAARQQWADESMEIKLPDPDLFTGLGTLDVEAEGRSPADPPRKFGRDIGRSGKKYTAEELEMLIKE